MPLNNYTPCMNVDQRRDETELITSYFQQGFTNVEKLEFLKLHGIEFSSSTLKRRLQSLGLRRRIPADEQVSQEDIERMVEHELSGSKCNVGYRKMWKHVMTKYGIAVQRDVIRKCLGWAQVVGKFLQRLRDFDLYNNSDPVQVDLIRFCFMDILRDELHKIAEM
ncbi:Hypothetical predicted protein [Paramuricea clavata]|uniref:Uncharacterized protein n=1 Tax=Paramuricea clavata TaxID=317549 RepID=A0A7D9K4F5_PARCT|nr:Hypothetical predicted protein [Paramuricea clavata]